MITLNYQNFEVQIVDESKYSSDPTNDLPNYSSQYDLNEHHIVSKHGIYLLNQGEVFNSCILQASGGLTTIHEHSAVIVKNKLYLAICDQICSLNLPTLDLNWHQSVDHATCFGVYYLAKFDCLICHGEIMVSRLTLEGKKVWEAGGKDIFTEGFRIKRDQIEVIDFNHEKYLIDIQDGKSFLISD